MTMKMNRIAYAILHAIESREVAVYYQPVLDLATGAIVEVEALVRRTHPHPCRISPSDFSPVAELETLRARVTALAKEFSSTVTGEGVEREDQVSLLRALCCDRGQGYDFIRPIPSSEMSLIFQEERWNGNGPSIARRLGEQCKPRGATRPTVLIVKDDDHLRITESLALEADETTPQSWGLVSPVAGASGSASNLLPSQAIQYLDSTFEWPIERSSFHSLPRCLNAGFVFRRRGWIGVSGLPDLEKVTRMRKRVEVTSHAQPLDAGTCLRQAPGRASGGANPNDPSDSSCACSGDLQPSLAA